MSIAVDAVRASDETTCRAFEEHVLVKLVYVKKPPIMTRNEYWVCTVKLESPVFNTIPVVTSNSAYRMTNFLAFKMKRIIPAIIPATYSSLIGGRYIIFNFSHKIRIRTFTRRNTVSKRRAGNHIRTSVTKSGSGHLPGGTQSAREGQVTISGPQSAVSSPTTKTGRNTSTP